IENIDDKAIASLYVKHVFPETFTVQTGGGGWHLYYLIKPERLDKRIRLEKNGVHYGEIQTVKNQCLGPGSLHPSGNKYTILNDCEIKTIHKDKLLEIVDGYYRKNEKDTNKFSINRTNLQWDISKLLKHCPGLETRDDVKYRGSHPAHGSEGGQNFEIDIDKNVWFCFRCDIGGDAVNLIAMIEGLIETDVACPTKEQFHKVFVQAKEIGIKKYGYPDDGFVAERKSVSQKLIIDENLNKRLFYKENKKVKMNYEETCKYLNEIKSFIVVRDTTGRAPHIYLYEKGYYRLNGEDFIRIEVKKICTKCGIFWQSYFEDSVMRYIRTENLKNRDDIVPEKYLLNFNNGVYNLITKRLMPHSPKHFFLYKIPWSYNSKAKFEKSKTAKYFKKTLKPEYVKFSQELFGYCLYSSYKFHGIFYLYGVGGNGKGVWVDLLQALLGNNNVTNKSINSLATKTFTSSKLYGKLANICGEISHDQLKNTDMLKGLSS
ncbi:unnamed protein product, partial [marine sediment metagenome]